MKYLLVLTDGMADYPVPELDGKTPLEYARTPNMDSLAGLSVLGKVNTIPDSMPPGSDVANLSVMGYDPEKYYTGRSPIEAISMGVSLEPEDLAFRCNLVTLSAEDVYASKTMLDYSAGEIESAEAAALIQSLAAELGEPQLEFHPGISYRHLMVWRGAGSLNPVLTPPHDISDRVIGPYLPGGDGASRLTSLMERSCQHLEAHPLNAQRREKGCRPATSIWLWGQGHRPALDSFYSRYGLKGSVVAAVDLVKGLGISAGLEAVKVPGATGAIKTDFAAKARAAINELKKGQDFVYMHIESPDECGHQGDALTKVWSIEQIDREVIGYIMSQLDLFDDFRLLITPDHPTPVALKTHSREPVPFLLYDRRHPAQPGADAFNERAAEGGLYVHQGFKLMDLFVRGSL